jgi:two-component system, NarL family, nitrate/nitrite response regulator NarL
MIRVLIVDPVRLMCHVLRAVLEDEVDIEVIGCATSVDEALLQVSRSDVSLVSASSNEAEVELIERITMLNPSAKVLAVGLPADKDVILRHLEAGAAGYVLSEDSLDRLLDSVRAVWQQAAYVSPEVAAALIARLAELHIRCDRDGDNLGAGADLSPREREVLELVRQGLTNREIADRLTIELGTVKNHMHNVLKKLNVKTRREAAHVFG